jgi:hypothetical protein
MRFVIMQACGHCRSLQYLFRFSSHVLDFTVLFLLEVPQSTAADEHYDTIKKRDQ